MEISGILKALPLTLRICLWAFLFSISTPTLSQPLLFKQSVDTRLPMAPQGHLMDLKGAWSLALNSSSNSEFKGRTHSAYAVVPLTSNTANLFHGYYLSPSYIYTSGEDGTPLNSLGNKGWQLALGRANLNFPNSIFRGFIQLAYRTLDINDDTSTTEVKNKFQLLDEKKKSFILSTGVSSTQNSLMNQSHPLLDSELIFLVRYDYEEGDFYTHAKASLFYPSLVEFGASIAWFKVFTENANSVFTEVSDDFIFGPRLRVRAWKRFAIDASLDWHAYRDFDGKMTVPTPRAQASLICNF